MTTTMEQAGLDGRVTGEDGQPAEEARLYRGWFRVTRADGPAGVVLTARIPGYHEDGGETSPHRSQGAAGRAARAIYDQYRADVRALAPDEDREV